MRVLDRLPALLAVLIAVMATPAQSAAIPAPADPVVPEFAGPATEGKMIWPLRHTVVQ